MEHLLHPEYPILEVYSPKMRFWTHQEVDIDDMLAINDTAKIFWYKKGIMEVTCVNVIPNFGIVTWIFMIKMRYWKAS